MSRASMVLNVLLVFVVAALAWMLHAHADDGGASRERLSVNNAGPILPPTSGIDADTTHRLVAQLARIDTQLAALENGASRGVAIATAVPEMSAAEADRRLGQLLPRRQIDHREFAAFQTGLAELPPAEQFALSAALSRAVNENRIRMRP